MFITPVTTITRKETKLNQNLEGRSSQRHSGKNMSMSTVNYSISTLKPSFASSLFHRRLSPFISPHSALCFSGVLPPHSHRFSFFFSSNGHANSAFRSLRVCKRSTFRLYLLWEQKIYRSRIQRIRKQIVEYCNLLIWFNCNNLLIIVELHVDLDFLQSLALDAISCA